LCARLSNGTSGFFLGAGGGRAVSHAEPTGAPRTLSGLHKFSEHQGGPTMKVQTTTEHFSNLFPCKVGYEYAFDAREHLTLIVSNPLKPPPLTGREDQIRFL